MNEFKAGDLALVIRAKNPENVGKVVELLRYDNSQYISHAPYGPGSSLNINLEPGWLVKSEGLLIGRAYSPDNKAIETIAAFRQSHLMPLKGDFAPVKEKQEEQPA